MHKSRDPHGESGRRTISKEPASSSAPSGAGRDPARNKLLRFGLPHLRPPTELVTQEDLADLFALQCAMEEAKGEYDTLHDAILDALRRGCKVEEGLRTVAIKEELEIL